MVVLCTVEMAVSFCVFTKNMLTPSFTEFLHPHLQNLVTEHYVNTREFITLVWCWQGSTGRRWGHGVVCLCSQATFNQIKPHPAGLIGAVKLSSSVKGIFIPFETKFSEALCDRGKRTPPSSSWRCQLCWPSTLFCIETQWGRNAAIRILWNIPDRVRGDHFHVTLL